ncbi:MAG: 5'-methylthioadenosine/S-adenosylhomocysteine nucleosidase [Gammaproteobacteria bacterium]|nr:5'-methylthioadenosine/S-adenosylhomocysteine nucleosidase [Gammaproteobacteria bacterium]
MNRPRAVFVTAISPEWNAVVSYLKNRKEEEHEQGTIYETGDYRISKDIIWQVGVAQIDMGNASAALETERAIRHFNPSHLFFVGVAGGIKEVALGDVVAASKICGYESGKEGNEFKKHAEVKPSSYAMKERAKSMERNSDWLKHLPPDYEKSPKAMVATIAAGEKVIASKRTPIYQRIQQHCGDAKAVEMEGIGFLTAVNANKGVEAIVIRGISDLLENKAEDDKQGWQEIAARHAAAFAFAMLGHIKPSQSAQSSSGTPPKMPQDSWPYLVDYKDQNNGFWNMIRKHRKDENPRRGRPLVCLLPGGGDCITTHMLLKRLMGDLEKHLPFCDTNYRSLPAPISIKTYPLEYYGLRTPDSLEWALSNDVEEKLFSLSSSKRKNISQLRSQQLFRPVVFHADLEVGDLNGDQGIKLLKKFYDFWGGWTDQHHLFLICVFLSYAKEPSRPREWILGGGWRYWTNRRFKSMLAHIDPSRNRKICGTILPELSPVGKNDVKDWIDKMEHQELINPETTLCLLTEIENLFIDRKTQRMKDSLPMRCLCPKLKSLLEEECLPETSS